MVTFTHVLCPIDFSDTSLRALDYAVAVAHGFDARLTVLHVAPTFDSKRTGPGDPGEDLRIVRTPTRDEIVAELRDAARGAGARADEVTAMAEAGDPVPVILDQTLAQTADLLVLGTHGRSGFDRLLLGSVTEKVLRRAGCPVLTVPPHATKASVPSGGFPRVLCPMDFSPAALQALGFALGLAREPDGSVTVMHTVEWLAEQVPRAKTHFDIETFRRLLLEDAHERLREVVADASIGSKTVKEVVTAGRAHTQILRLASDHDLIVMGAQGFSGLAASHFGSTTQHVVRGATCPVLTVKAADAVTS